MRTFLVSVVIAVVWSTTGFAQQQIVSSPFPTDVGTDGACYVRNTSSKPIAVQVFVHSNNGVVVQFENCNAQPLGAGRTCVVLVSLPDSSYAACYARAEKTGRLRGTFEVRETPSPVNAQLRVLVAGDLK